MKKTILFLCWLTLTLVMTSCTNQNEQKLVSGDWRLQNPENASYNSTMIFNKDGSLINNFYIMGINGSNQSASGTYSCSGENEVEINLGGLDCHCHIMWYSDNRFSLEWQGKILFFAQSNTSEDTYVQRYNEAVAKVRAAQAAAVAAARAAASGYYSSGVYYNNGGGQPVNDQTSKICTICHGTKECSICKGIGYCSNYGYRSECKACNHTGICWHCHGTGYEP